MSAVQKRARRQASSTKRARGDDTIDPNAEVRLGDFSHTVGIPTPSEGGISTRVSREQEQQWLQSLNRRLEVYIAAQKQRDYSTINAVADLKGVEHELEFTMQRQKKAHQAEIRDYKKEISELKKSLDQHDHVVVDIQRQNTVLEQSLEDQREATGELRQENSELLRQLEEYKLVINDYKRNSLLNERESERIRKDRDRLLEEVGDDQSVSKMKREQERQILALQNKVNLLENQLNVEQSQHEDEVGRLHAQLQAVKDEHRDNQQHLLDDFNVRLAEEIDLVKQEAEEQKEELAEELRKTYDHQIQKYVSANNDLRNQLGDSHEVRKVLEAQITKYKTELVNLESANEAFNAQVNKLEEELELATEDFQDQIDQYQRRIDDLSNAYQDKEHQFDDLMDIKVSLAMEINGYRRLIESEEQRLGINLASHKPSSRRSISTRDQTDRLVIAGVDLGGDFVKFRNGSTNVINLSNWRLTSDLTNESYVFPNQEIEPNAQFIVYFGPNNKSQVKKSKHLAYAVDIFTDDRDDSKGTLFDNLGREVQSFQFIDKGNR